MVIRYDSAETTDVELGRAITELGYTIERVDARIPSTKSAKRVAWKAPVPDESPEFFRKAFAEARKKRRPIILDFWASWCAPCLQLKKETFADAKVRALLERCQVIYVDLDKNPKLGELYGVTAVPDVFLIDRNGRVVDRFQNFEPPDPFRKRVQALLALGTESQSTNGRAKNGSRKKKP